MIAEAPSGGAETSNNAESSTNLEPLTKKAKLSDNPEMLKIDESKIYRLHEKNDQILKKTDRCGKQLLFVESNDLDQLNNVFCSFCLNDFPNIFVVVVKIDFDMPESDVLSFLAENVKSHEILLQLLIKDSFKWFYMKENDKSFKELGQSGSKPKELKEIVEFLEAINSQKKTLISFDFKNNEKEYEKSLNDAVKLKNKLLVKLFALFLKQKNIKNGYDENLLKIASQTENADIIIAIMSNSSSEDCKKCLTDIKNDELKEMIFLKIAKTNNINLLKFLLELVDFKTWCEMRKIASSRNFTEFTYELHKYEKQTPDYDKNVENLYTYIENGNLEGVKQFVNDFPYLKLCMKVTTCALNLSIKKEQVEIYYYLKSRGFISFSSDTLRNIINEKAADNKKFCDEMKKFNLKYLIECTEKDLNVLASKFKFSKDTCKENSENCRKILENVRKIEGANVMIKILSQSDVKIAMNMDKSVDGMLSICNGLVGYADRDNCTIYMSKGNNEPMCEATFVHEMTHYVCFLIYENLSLPFCSDDMLRKENFDKILKNVKNHCCDDVFAEIFKETFYETDHSQKCELIARVPEFLSNREKIGKDITKSIEEKYPELNNFYQDILNDFKPLNVYEVIKLNNTFNFIEKIRNFEYQVLPKEKFNPNSNRLILISKTPQLVLTKIFNEIVKFSENKLDLKTKNIFINTEMPDLTYHGHLVEKLAIESCAERIILNAELKFETNVRTFKNLVRKISKITKKSMKNFGIVVVVDESHSNIIKMLQEWDEEFHSKEVNISWSDLKPESQNLLKKRKIKFQNVEKTADELFDISSQSVNLDVLKILCGKAEISINCTLQLKNSDDFIQRMIETKIPNENKSNQVFNFFPSVCYEKFMINTRKNQNFQNIVLISDPAGGGKTFLFKKCCDDFKKSNPDNFILFVTLKNHQNDFKKDLKDSFVDFIVKTQNFDALTKVIFEQKYKKGETIIFFDAYDVVPLDCKENVKKLFELFEFNETNQIFISTRPNFELELENKLNVLASRIKILDKKQQILVLMKFWNNSGKNVNLENCAQKLTEKLFEVLQPIGNLIGVPIILINLAKYFKIKIENEKYFEKREFDSLNISQIYKITVLENMLDYTENILKSINLATTLTSPIQIHQFLAIKSLLDVKTANHLGLFHDETKWSFDVINKYGIVDCKDEIIEFGHETFAEFLAALLLFELLKNLESFGKPQMTFMIAILEKEEIKLSRMFFNSMLSKVQDYELEFKFLRSKHEILCKNYEFLTTSDKHILNKCCEEKLFYIFDFFAHLLFEFQEHFKNLIVSNNFELPKVLAFANTADKKKVEINLINIFKSKISFEELLMKSDLLSTAAQYSTQEIFDIIWLNSKKFLNNDQKFKEIAQNSQILIKSLSNQYNPDVFEYIFKVTEFFDETMREPDKDQFFKNGNNGYKLLCEAAKIGSKKNLKFLFNNLKKFYLQNYVKVLENNKNELLVRAVCFNCKNSVKFIWKIYEENFTEDEMFKIITEKDEENLDFNFFGKIALWATSDQGVQVFYKKIKKLFKKESILKEYLLTKYQQRSNQNALMFAAVNFWKNDFIFKFIFDTVYSENFSKLDDFIYEVDNFKENILHKLLRAGNPSSLEFGLKRLKDERKKLLEIKNDQNYFYVIRHFKPELYQEKLFLFENFIDNKEKLRNMLQEVDRNNLSPLHKSLNIPEFLTFIILFKFYEKHFSKSEIENILNNQKIKFFRDKIEEAKLYFNPCSKDTAKEIKDELAKYNIQV